MHCPALDTMVTALAQALDRWPYEAFLYLTMAGLLIWLVVNLRNGR